MKHREVSGEWVCACDPTCDNCERRFRCLDAGPTNSILQGKRTESQRFNTIAELQKINDRLTAANAKLRQALERIAADTGQFTMTATYMKQIAREALKEGE